MIVTSGNIKEKQIKGKQKILIVILVVIAAAAVAVSIWAVWFRDTMPVSTPDYAPQQIESNAQPIDEKDTAKLEQQERGGAVSLTYSNKASLSLSTRETSLMFQNPTKSNQDMKIEIAIDNKTIVESGRLEPGYKVDKLADADIDKLSVGTYEGKFIVSYYDAASGEKAIVNTEIPLTITVMD